MDPVGWLMVGAGAMMLAVGSLALWGAFADLPRHHARWAIAFGLGAVLQAVARYRAVPGEDWVTWTALACVFSALFLQWSSYRRMRATRRPPRTAMVP